MCETYLALRVRHVYYLYLSFLNAVTCSLQGFSFVSLLLAAWTVLTHLQVPLSPYFSSFPSCQLQSVQMAIQLQSVADHWPYQYTTGFSKFYQVNIVAVCPISGCILLVIILKRKRQQWQNLYFPCAVIYLFKSWQRDGYDLKQIS